MSIPFDNWPYQWFDCPNSLDIQASLPQLSDLIDVSWSPPDINDIVQYLELSPVYTTTLAADPRCAICGHLLHESSTWHWDDTWLWPHTLAHFVREHSVRLPDSMVAHIRERRYEPPPVTECNFSRGDAVYAAYFALVMDSDKE